MNVPFVLLVSQAAPLQCPANGLPHNKRLRTARAGTDAPAANCAPHEAGVGDNEQADAALLLEAAAAAVPSPSDRARSRPRKQRCPKMAAIAADYNPDTAEMLRAAYKAEAAQKAAEQAVQHDLEEQAMAMEDEGMEVMVKCIEPMKGKAKKGKQPKEEPVVGAGVRKGKKGKGKQHRAPAKKHRAV